MSGAEDRPRMRKSRGEEDEAGHANRSADTHVSAEAPPTAAWSTADTPTIASAWGAEPAAAALVPPADPSACAADDKPESARATAGGVQPLPEQLRQSKRRRRSPRFACHMDRLAVVELQLVLQCLDPRSRLVAARCSRRLLQAADHPFAWSAAEPFHIDSRIHADFGTRVSRSLLRHAPIGLRLGWDISTEQVYLVPRLRNLAANSSGSLQLASLRALQGLQTLRLSWGPSAGDTPLLTSLPQLHTLHLDCALSDGDDWSWLPAMPALTDLSLFLYSYVSSIHEAVGQCPRLQSLRLVCPNFPPGAFRRFCSAPAMRRLRQLRLVDLDVSDWDLSPDEWRAGFSQLAQLDSLILFEVEDIDLLLPHLAHAPALRALIIPLFPSHNDPQPTAHPSSEVVCQLLTAAPRLQVRLRMAATLEAWRLPPEKESNDFSDHEREWMDEQWRRLQRMAAELDRVSFIDAI